MFCSVTSTNLGQLSKLVLESARPEDSKTVPDFDNRPRFVGDIEQNKISDFYEKYCMYVADTHLYVVDLVHFYTLAACSFSGAKR